MILKQQQRSRRRAATIVETAVVMSMTIIMICAVYEYGRFLMIRHLVNNAAREGARMAVVSPSYLDPTSADNSVRDCITTHMAGQPLDNFAIEIYEADDNGNRTGLWTDAPFGTNIAVVVTGDYRPMLPSFGLLPDPVPVKSKVMMRAEAD